MEDRGFELSPENAGKSSDLARGGAECGALLADSAVRGTPDGDENEGRRGVAGGPLDASLATIIERWPTLPDDVRQAIVAMVKAAGR
jgi:hypothetical protein